MKRFATPSSPRSMRNPGLCAELLHAWTRRSRTADVKSRTAASATNGGCRESVTLRPRTPPAGPNRCGVRSRRSCGPRGARPYVTVNAISANATVDFRATTELEFITAPARALLREGYHPTLCATSARHTRQPRRIYYYSSEGKLSPHHYTAWPVLARLESVYETADPRALRVVVETTVILRRHCRERCSRTGRVSRGNSTIMSPQETQYTRRVRTSSPSTDADCRTSDCLTVATYALFA